MNVSMPYGVTRFPGFGVTGDEDGSPFQWSFYPIGSVAPSAVLPPGRGFEAGRGAILNFGAFLVRHTIVGDEAFNPYQFDPATHANRVQYLAGLFEANRPGSHGVRRSRRQADRRFTPPPTTRHR